MNASNILQVLAILLLLIGGYILFEHFSGNSESSSMTAGIGPIVIGIALMIISFSKTLRKDKTDI